MDEPIENLYFNWLYARVVTQDPRRGEKTFVDLLIRLHRTEFVWLLSGDDNRCEDGKELRKEFLIQADLPDDPEWRETIGCSVLEMLIAFARRAEFQTDDPLSVWFWEFIRNLGLDRFSDQEGFDGSSVDDILDVFISRTYSPNGNGGLFPIKNPSTDQRDVEIWYQFCEYLVDSGRID